MQPELSFKNGHKASSSGLSVVIGLAKGIPGLCGVDTREIVRITREEGVMNAMICDEVPADLSTVIAFGDWKLPMYSWIIIFICSRVIDFILEGPKRAKTMMIITDKSEDLRKFIINDMGRGATMRPGTGLYSGQGRDIIYVVLGRREMIRLREQIARIDPAAFINVLESAEILGEGFQSLQGSESI